MIPYLKTESAHADIIGPFIFLFHSFPLLFAVAVVVVDGAAVVVVVVVVAYLLLLGHFGSGSSCIGVRTWSFGVLAIVACCTDIAWVW